MRGLICSAYPLGVHLAFLKKRFRCPLISDVTQYLTKDVSNPWYSFSYHCSPGAMRSSFPFRLHLDRVVDLGP